MMNRRLSHGSGVRTQALSALGQPATQRDVQQTHHRGLKDGSRPEGRRGSNGKRARRSAFRRRISETKLSPAERAIGAAENKVSADIAADKHNAVTGNPNSASSRRMQADVARNVNQDKRIEAGIQNSSLTNREVAKLDRGQAEVDRKEARAAADGHVGRTEQAGIQRSENRQSRRIFNQKHDGQLRG
jgi:hypothetical protein